MHDVDPTALIDVASAALLAFAMTGSGNGSDRRGGNVRAFPTRAGMRNTTSRPRGQGRGLQLLVIDARSLTRDCLVAAMEATSGVDKVIASASVEEAIPVLSAIGGVDAALVNLATDPFGEAELAALNGALRATGAVDAIILLTGLTDAQHAVAAMREGVKGLLSSDMPFDLTIDAIRLVSLGWMVYPAFEPSSLLPRPVPPPKRADAPGDTGLTPRQQQVLGGLERGMRNRDIATQLGVSERTIKAHVQELMRRLGASNRTQVVALMSGRARSVQIIRAEEE